MRAGREDDARGVYEEFDARVKREPIPGLHHALVCAVVGDMDRALDLLERSAETREACNIMVARWPDMEMLRGQPRYEALLQRTGFK